MILIVSLLSGRIEAGERADTLVVRLGILLPSHNVPISQDPCFSSAPILRNVNHFRNELKTLTIWKGGGGGGNSNSPRRVSIRSVYMDSQCSDTYGPLHAVELYLKENVHAFYGPCCKYALSPVVRYATIWNVPVITPGGLTPAFSDKSMYPMLTRISAPYDKLAHFLYTVFEHFGWKTISVLWHNFIVKRSLGNSEDHQTAVAIINAMRTIGHREPHKESFDETYYEAFDWDKILMGIRNRSRGRGILLLFLIIIINIIRSGISDFPMILSLIACFMP